jgi:hypothetical protein
MKRKWPDWWEWEPELSPHLLKRMADRRFTEVDLREMLEKAEGWPSGVVEAVGSFILGTAGEAGELS